jgi:hypothetical protein
MMTFSRRDHPPVQAPGQLATCELSPAQTLLWDLINSSIVLQEQWDVLGSRLQQEIRRSPDAPSLLAALVKHRLLTQAAD